MVFLDGSVPDTIDIFQILLDNTDQLSPDEGGDQVFQAVRPGERARGR